MKDCENVFFKGKNAAELDIVDFEERRKKLRPDDEEESEWEVSEQSEEEEAQAASDDGSYDHEKFLASIYKGIMVIKSKEEEVTLEKGASEEADNGEIKLERKMDNFYTYVRVEKKKDTDRILVSDKPSTNVT